MSEKANKEKLKKDLREGFDMFDYKNFGVVNPNELKEIMDAMNLQQTNPFLYNIIDNLSKNELVKQRGGIDATEFISILDNELEDCYSKDGIEKIFSVFSNPISKIVTLPTFSQAAKEVGDEEKEEQIKELIDKGQLTNDEIHFNDFYEIVKTNQKNKDNNESKVYVKKSSSLCDSNNSKYNGYNNNSNVGYNNSYKNNNDDNENDVDKFDNYINNRGKKSNYYKINNYNDNNSTNNYYNNIHKKKDQIVDKDNNKKEKITGNGDKRYYRNKSETNNFTNNTNNYIRNPRIINNSENINNSKNKEDNEDNKQENNDKTRGYRKVHAEKKIPVNEKANDKTKENINTNKNNTNINSNVKNEEIKPEESSISNRKRKYYRRFRGENSSRDKNKSNNQSSVSSTNKENRVIRNVIEPKIEVNRTNLNDKKNMNNIKGKLIDGNKNNNNNENKTEETNGKYSYKQRFARKPVNIEQKVNKKKDVKEENLSTDNKKKTYHRRYRDIKINNNENNSVNKNENKKVFSNEKDNNNKYQRAATSAYLKYKKNENNF